MPSDWTDEHRTHSCPIATVSLSGIEPMRRASVLCWWKKFTVWTKQDSQTFNRQTVHVFGKHHACRFPKFRKFSQSGLSQVTQRSPGHPFMVSIMIPPWIHETECWYFLLATWINGLRVNHKPVYHIISKLANWITWSSTANSLKATDSLNPILFFLIRKGYFGSTGT